MFTPTPDLEELFERAGWDPARQVEPPLGVPPEHPAFDMLRSLTGLTIGRSGNGIECAASDIRFQFLPCDAAIAAWCGWLATELVGIAAVHNLHGELYVDGTGRCFGRSVVHDAFYFEGHSFSESIGRLVDGRRSKPMMRPDQVSVRLYGRTYTRESPELYRFA